VETLLNPLKNRDHLIGCAADPLDERADPFGRRRIMRA
jgi:hypothetical protein